jgi:hypothetical protein
MHSYAYLMRRRRPRDGLMPHSRSPNQKQDSETFSSGMRLCVVSHTFTDFFEDPTDFIFRVDDTSSLSTLVSVAI